MPHLGLTAELLIWGVAFIAVLWLVARYLDRRLKAPWRRSS